MNIIDKLYFKRQEQLDTANALLTHGMKEMFKDMSVQSIKEMIKEDDTEMLKSLLQICLETEDYEICEAVIQILNGRTEIK